MSLLESCVPSEVDVAGIFMYGSFDFNDEAEIALFVLRFMVNNGNCWRSFTPEELVDDFGLDLSSIRILEGLAGKKFLKNSNNRYSVTERFISAITGLE